MPPMNDNAYNYHDSRDREGARHHASQYSVLQPQYRQPVGPNPSRDRYRTAQYTNSVYDEVEDDDTYGEGMQFDSFGMYNVTH
jgi:hypothetical protein